MCKTEIGIWPNWNKQTNNQTISICLGSMEWNNPGAGKEKKHKAQKNTVMSTLMPVFFLYFIFHFTTDF